MAKAVGIDLGTTNSVVSVLEAGDPVVIPNAEGARTTPSVVAFAKTGEVLVGEVAKRQAITNPDRTIRSVKRHMGTELVDRHRRQGVHAAGDLGPHAAEAEARRRGLPGRHRHPGRHHRAGVLRRRRAHRHQGGRPDRRASRCCASSTSRPRPPWPTGSTRRARTRPSSCSTSAAAPSTCRSSRSATACSRSRPPTATRNLGGDDWDQKVIDWLVTAFKAGHGIDLSKDNMAVQRLKEAAEKAKIELSQVQQTQINLPFITATADGPLHLDEPLSRAKFQELTATCSSAAAAPSSRPSRTPASPGRHRPRDPGRWLHPHAGRARARAAT